MLRRSTLGFLVWALGCAGSKTTSDPAPIVPVADAAVDDDAPVDARMPAEADAPPPPPPPKPDAAPATAWTDTQKCENMCQSYCVKKYMCDGSSIEECRMAIDHADGGTCAERAHLFSDIPQSQVQACIDAIDPMSCPDFIHMYNTGQGVPKACYGILI